MRLAFFILTVLVAAGSIWLSDIVNADANRAGRQVELQRALAENGVRRMLWSSEAYDFSDVVLGETTAAGDMVFRGMIAQNGGSGLAYGHARSICDGRFDDPACWTVSYLEIDGRTVQGANGRFH